MRKDICFSLVIMFAKIYAQVLNIASPIPIPVRARVHARKPYSDAVVANQLPNDRVSGYGTLINSRKM